MTIQCIHCKSKKIQKIGLTHKGKKRFKCLLCNSSFQESYIRPKMDDSQLPAKVIIITELVRRIRCAYEENIFTEVEINLILPLLKEIRSSLISRGV
jgi:transposase-like protein